jgi:hypothetical protein
VDVDGDGVLNELDNCPIDFNPFQENNDPELRPNGPDVPDIYDGTWVNHDEIGNACDPDDDNDGFFDTDELSGVLCSGITTNPLLLDSDGDRLTDAWECLKGSDPNSAADKAYGAGLADTDNDRIPDLWEQRGYNGSITGPSRTDTDNDGCHDLVELASFDGNRLVNDSDRLAVARRVLFLWAPDPVQDAVLDVNKNGFMDDSDRLFVARAALLPDWQPKMCP